MKDKHSITIQPARHVDHPERIDARALNAKVDLFALVARDGVVLGNGINERAGPCPRCSSNAKDDRFHVRRASQFKDGIARCFCRKCHGDPKGSTHVWLDPIACWMWTRQTDTFRAACAALNAFAGGGEIPTLNADAVLRETAAAQPELPPALPWQTVARSLVDECAAYLWSDRKDAALALSYLHNERGLNDDTIKTYKLGYNPNSRSTVCSGYEKGLWLARGLVIPCEIVGEQWYVQVRRPKADLAADLQRGRSPRKYMKLTGSSKGLFNADRLTRETQAAIVTGGEFDCLLAQQYAASPIAVVTFGSESNVPSTRWTMSLRNIRRGFVATDNDEAGDAAKKRWAEALPRFKSVAVPAPHKDITDFWKAGHNVAQWVFEATSIPRWTIPDTPYDRVILYDKVMAQLSAQMDMPVADAARLMARAHCCTRERFSADGQSYLALAQ